MRNSSKPLTAKVLIISEWLGLVEIFLQAILPWQPTQPRAHNVLDITRLWYAWNAVEGMIDMHIDVQRWRNCLSVWSYSCYHNTSVQSAWGYHVPSSPFALQGGSGSHTKISPNIFPGLIRSSQDWSIIHHDKKEQKTKTQEQSTVKRWWATIFHYQTRWARFSFFFWCDSCGKKPWEERFFPTLHA